jgi:class 3 adenylate cyclase
MRRWQSGEQRDPRTVLFTDIVGSTDEAARVGHRAWANVLARHHSVWCADATQFPGNFRILNRVGIDRRPESC